MRTSPYASFSSNPFRAIFGILTWPRTYLNLLYLMIAFPLGLAYFVFYVVGGSLGIGLAILGIGLVLLFLLVPAAWALAHFERLLANALLGANVPEPAPTRLAEGGWPWVKSVYGNSVTWKGLAFQLLKFPLGLTSWICAVVALSIVGALIAAPLILHFGGTITISPWWIIDTPGEAWTTTAIGLASVLPALHLLNGVAYLWALLARFMLGRRQPAEPASPAWVPSGEPIPAL